MGGMGSEKRRRGGWVVRARCLVGIGRDGTAGSKEEYIVTLVNVIMVIKGSVGGEVKHDLVKTVRYRKKSEGEGETRRKECERRCA